MVEFEISMYNLRSSAKSLALTEVSEVRTVSRVDEVRTVHVLMK